MTALTKNLARTMLKKPLGRAIITLTAAAATIASIAMWQPAPASAHCDSANGPASTAARAVEAG